MKSASDITPPRAITQKTITSKFKQNFKNGSARFEIELLEGVLYIHNDMNLLIEIPYSDAKSKKRIYNALWLLPDVFDFSFTLEAYDIETLERFIMSAMVDKASHPTVFGDSEQTRQRKYKIITDNLHLQDDDHVIDLYKSNPDSISLIQGLTKNESRDITMVEMNCVYRNPRMKADGAESLIVKMTVNFQSSVNHEGREVKEVVAFREDGVTALIKSEADNKPANAILRQPLHINTTYKSWYLELLQVCFDVANKESKTLWTIKKS